MARELGLGGYGGAGGRPRHRPLLPAWQAEQGQG